MLALVVAVALAQCTKDTDCKGERVCTDGVCIGAAGPRRRVELSPAALGRRELLFAQRPSFIPPLVSMAIGAAFVGLGIALAAGSANGDPLALGLGCGGAVLIGGVAWFFAVLWARSRIGDMIEALE